jgi:hypothetical protein
METDPISKTLCPFMFFRILGNGRSPKPQLETDLVSEM